MTNDEHDAFTALPGPRRIALLDRAVGEIGALDPRPCGQARCPPLCTACVAATAEVLRWLTARECAVPEIVGPLAWVEPPARVQREPVPKERVVELLRSRRQLTATEQQVVALLDGANRPLLEGQ